MEQDLWECLKWDQLERAMRSLFERQWCRGPPEEIKMYTMRRSGGRKYYAERATNSEVGWVWLVLEAMRLPVWLEA